MRWKAPGRWRDQGREATRRTRIDAAGGVSASPLTPSPDARCGRHEVPPLRMSDLRIDMDNELGGALTEGAFRVDPTAECADPTAEC